MTDNKDLTPLGRASPMPPAVVAKCGWVNGLDAIRSLGRVGIPVIAIDYSAEALGFRSRYATPLLCPDPVLGEEDFVRFMIELGERLPQPAPLFPTNDEVLNVIARNRDELGDRFLYPFPDWKILGPLQNKRFQVERAGALGIPHPKTSYEPTTDFGFPVLVKPSDPAPFQRAFRRHAFRCDTREELELAFNQARPFEPLVQEFIPGGDDELYTLGAYVDEQGRTLGVFSGRKLRQTPKAVGTCRVGEAVWIDEVVEQGLRYIQGLEYHGIAQVEFKRDARDGSYKLMEINPRLWQWHGLASACGVDFPRIAYGDMIGHPPLPASTRQSRKRWAIALMPGARPAFVRPPFVEPVFSLDDIRPGLVHFWRVGRATIPGRVIRRVARGFRRRIALLAGA